MYLDARLNLIKDPSREIDKNTSDLLLRFLLTFNLFERVFFDQTLRDEDGKRYLAHKHLLTLSEKLVREQGFQTDRMKEFARHFAERYEVTGYRNGNDKYESLYMCPEIKRNVAETLLYAENGTVPTRHRDDRFGDGLDVDMIYHSLQIAYRYRNNLFHGLKGLEMLDQYQEEFKLIVEMLTYILEYANKHQYLIPNANRNK